MATKTPSLPRPRGTFGRRDQDDERRERFQFNFGTGSRNRGQTRGPSRSFSFGGPPPGGNPLGGGTVDAARRQANRAPSTLTTPSRPTTPTLADYGIDPRAHGDVFVNDAFRELLDREAKVAANPTMEQRRDFLIAQARLRLAERQALERERLPGAIRSAAAPVIGSEVARAAQQFEMSAGRRGLTGSGVEQAGLQAIEAQGAAQLVTTVAQARAQLEALQMQQRGAFDQGAFAFTTGMFSMAEDQAFQREVMRWEQQVRQDEATAAMWGEVFGSVGSIAGAYVYGKARG